MPSIQFLRTVIYIPMAVIACWMGMMLIHESGHIVAALCTGTDFQRIQYPIFGFSQTIYGHITPHPLIVAWCGPLVGSLAPAIIALTLRFEKFEVHFATLFAGFCLIANGAYIGIGSFWHTGDCGDLLREGAPIWTLWFFGLVAIPAGFWLWHTLGGRFGIPAGMRNLDILLAASMATLLVGVSLLSTAIHRSP